MAHVKYFFVILFLIITLTSCKDEVKVVYTGTEQLSEHVYYINIDPGYFAQYYEQFLKSLDSSYKVVNVFGDGNGGYGRDQGYFIIVEKVDTFDF